MKTVGVLKKLDKDTSADVYYVGGYVRDLIRRKRNNDLDIVVRNLALRSIVDFLNKYGKVKRVNLAKVNDKFGVSVLLFKAFKDKQEAQISLPRRGVAQIPSPSNTLKQDAKHRDFTLNAMYLPVRYKSSKEDLIDFVGGRQSILSRRIYAVGNAVKRFEESPIRIMRAVSLASRMEYSLSDDITNAIKQCSPLLKKVPAENIRRELNKILLCRKPSKYFKLMRKLGILKVILPELDKCAGVKQDKRYHKYDVFDHCLYTCDNIKDKNIILRLSALLHDIGKPDTRREEGDRTTFHKHEMVGTRIAKDILDRLKYDNRTKKETLELIRLHMYHYSSNMYKCTNVDQCNWQKSVNQIKKEPEQCPKCGAEVVIQSGWKDSAVRRFIKKIDIKESDLNKLGEIPLFKLRIAERLGNGLKVIPVTEKQKDFQRRITEVFRKSRGLEIKDLEVDGDIIRKIFNMEQSPEIGKVLHYLMDKVLEDPKLNNLSDLIRLTGEYIYSRIKSDKTDGKKG